MRQSHNNKGGGRRHGGRGSSGNTSRRPSNAGQTVNRVFESIGPEGKIRGFPQQLIEKYQLMTVLWQKTTLSMQNIM